MSRILQTLNLKHRRIMTDEQRVFVRGVKGRGSEVIKILEDLGGKVPPLDLGGNPKYIYFISHDGDITCMLYESEGGKIIMDFYREIKLPEQWKDGDIIVENNTNPVYSVFKSAEGNGKFSEYFCVTIDGIIKANIFRSISKWHLANKEERKTFTNLLHKHCKDWDSEKKQLVDWKWKPKEDEDYWAVILDTTIIKLVFTWLGSVTDEIRYKLGNCFRTREEAEAMVEKIKELLNAK